MRWCRDAELELETSYKMIIIFVMKNCTAGRISRSEIGTRKGTIARKARRIGGDKGASPPCLSPPIAERQYNTERKFV